LIAPAKLPLSNDPTNTYDFEITLKNISLSKKPNQDLNAGTQKCAAIIFHLDGGTDSTNDFLHLYGAENNPL